MEKQTISAERVYSNLPTQGQGRERMRNTSQSLEFSFKDSFSRNNDAASTGILKANAKSFYKISPVKAGANRNHYHAMKLRQLEEYKTQTLSLLKERMVRTKEVLRMSDRKSVV